MKLGMRFVLALIPVMVGAGMLAYGLTQAIVMGPGNPAPNTNHVSTIPTPPRR